MSRATGASDASKDDFLSKLSRVVQLTGFSDPVYAEAYVNVHQFDIDLGEPFSSFCPFRCWLTLEKPV